jgi:hypothetical protein
MTTSAKSTLWAIIGWSFASSALAVTEVATVTKLGESYEIYVKTVDQSFIPFHPDKGFFPKLRRMVQFVTTGPGTTKMIDGHPYQHFTLKRDIFPVLDNCLYSSGEILFSEESRELIIQGRLSERHSAYKNHSGKYTQVEFASPRIETLNKDLDLSNPDVNYVRATGTFVEHRTFLAEGKRHEITAWCPPVNGDPVDILARVYHPTAGNGAPYLFVLRHDGWPNGECNCVRNGNLNCKAKKSN